MQQFYTPIGWKPTIMDTRSTNKEIDRLISNQRTLLDVMPEMVLLVNNNKAIEYMNPSAVHFFGDLVDESSNSGAAEIRDSLLEEVKHQLKSSKRNGIVTTVMNNYHLEYSIAPFAGYRGDNLHWLIMRDVTQQKKHEQEMSLFHSNIELILSQKINELKESELIRNKLLKQLNSLKSHLDNQPSEGTMVGSSKALSELRDMVFQVAKSDATILITGESGTGKELVANLIRETSNRNEKPFLKINCNTINDSLLESDLFGYEKGSFTGAHAQRKGKFEVVDGGTIFLDEIGDISPRMQAALLRVLQDGEIIRVGGNSPIKVDVRIIAATNRDLAMAVKEGTFRLDLYYRLNIINISIPPLRERKEDIVDLVTHFVRRYRLAFKKDVNFLPKSIITRLSNHHWPGNIRELENVIQRAVLMAKSNMITEQELIFDVPAGEENDQSYVSLLQKFDGLSLKKITAEMERDIILYSLAKHNGNVAKTAQILKIGKTAFYDKLKRYDISAKSHK
jgi:transcriptional regulator with PAS, ATPase and Fis domain